MTRSENRGSKNRNLLYYYYAIKGNKQQRRVVKSKSKPQIISYLNSYSCLISFWNGMI